ncbi:hypothetical protein BZA77DRAFT_362633 [Pyronema omphalodes]|nr:hypothetical protein BZA77DRAFT_362633 [Pyronema omphalodes]
MSGLKLVKDRFPPPSRSTTATVIRSILKKSDTPEPGKHKSVTIDMSLSTSRIYIKDNRKAYEGENEDGEKNVENQNEWTTYDVTSDLDPNTMTRELKKELRFANDKIRDEKLSLLENQRYRFFRKRFILEDDRGEEILMEQPKYHTRCKAKRRRLLGYSENHNNRDQTTPRKKKQLSTKEWFKYFPLLDLRFKRPFENGEFSSKYPWRPTVVGDPLYEPDDTAATDLPTPITQFSSAAFTPECLARWIRNSKPEVHRCATTGVQYYALPYIPRNAYIPDPPSISKEPPLYLKIQQIEQQNNSESTDPLSRPIDIPNRQGRLCKSLHAFYLRDPQDLLTFPQLASGLDLIRDAHIYFPIGLDDPLSVLDIVVEYGCYMVDWCTTDNIRKALQQDNIEVPHDQIWMNGKPANNATGPTACQIVLHRCFPYRRHIILIDDRTEKVAFDALREIMYNPGPPDPTRPPVLIEVWRLEVLAIRYKDEDACFVWNCLFPALEQY